jgi:hypothetical protein
MKMTKYTVWGTCHNVKQHMRGVSTVTTEVASGLMISPVVARNNLSDETLKAAIVHNSFYYFIEGEHLKPLADSKMIREAYFSTKIKLGQSSEDINNGVIQQLLAIDPEFIIKIGLQLDPVIARDLLIKKDYENRVSNGCSDTVIASSGEHETLIMGVIKIYTADGKNHLVKKCSFEKILDTDIKSLELRLKDLDMAFAGSPPSMQERINKYILDIGFQAVKSVPTGDTVSGTKSLIKARYNFHKLILESKDFYIEALEASGSTWGEALMSFCDEVSGIEKNLPIGLKGSSILG